MDEKMYIHVTNKTALRIIASTLKDILPTDAIPKDEFDFVRLKIEDWIYATFDAIENNQSSNI